MIRPHWLPVIRVGDRAAHESIAAAARVAGVSETTMRRAVGTAKDFGLLQLIRGQRWLRFTPAMAALLERGGWPAVLQAEAKQRGKARLVFTTPRRWKTETRPIGRARKTA